MEIQFFLMRHNHEIHGNLARLLSTENLNIQHSNVDTACFNVETRTLTLPIWEKASDLVYQLLLSHESAHAIYTPNEDWTELTSVPMQFLNVTEDVRIEKLMKRRYPGLKKTFFGGYSELHQEDFFAIKNDDISKYNLADRINLYFKIGNFIDVDFNDEERIILEEIEVAETFLDSIRCAEKLYEYCKDIEQQKNIDSISFESGSGSGMNQQTSEQTSEENSQNQTNGQSESSHNSENTGTKNSSDGESKPEDQTQSKPEHDPTSNSNYVKTLSSFEKAINKLSTSKTEEINYVEIPKLNMDKIIIDPKNIHSLCRRYWNSHYTEDCFSTVDADYASFKSSAKKEVNYLVKEFECKKAADSYSRASESKTGILDCGSLHSYKFNDDIFKKIVTVADGKNHGLIFILDWSGSMDTVILDTCRQLFNLIWFCKKVSIPFEVYAFTNSWSYSYGKNSNVTQNSMVIDGNFNLLNVISSKVNTSTLNDHMKNLYRLAYHNKSHHSSYSCPNQLSLSGTPLNESLVTLHEIIPEFQKRTKVQKVQCVILTDGEAGALPRVSEVGMQGIGDNCFLRDKKLKTTYRFPKYSYYATHKFTDVLLRHLKDVYPYVNFIGIRLLTSGEIGTFVRNHLENNNYSDSYPKIMEEWKKNKSCVITCTGYDSYFGIYSSALNSSSDFDVEESASVTDIRNAFKKSLQSKKMNKKILSQFIDLIA